MLSHYRLLKLYCYKPNGMERLNYNCALSPGRILTQDASKLMFNRTINVSDLLSWKEETVQYVAYKGHVETIMISLLFRIDKPYPITLI